VRVGSATHRFDEDPSPVGQSEARSHPRREAARLANGFADGRLEAALEFVPNLRWELVPLQPPTGRWSARKVVGVIRDAQ